MEKIIEEIFNLIKKKMKEQGGYNRDAYKDLVSETVDYFIEKGKISEDENIEFIKENLMRMWNYLENKSSK